MVRYGRGPHKIPVGITFEGDYSDLIGGAFREQREISLREGPCKVVVLYK